MQDQHTEDVVRAWMNSYLAKSHPDMPRPGTVCPFVKPALDLGSVELRCVSTLAPHPEHVVLEATHRALDEFPPAGLLEHKSLLRALVLVFPDLVDQGHVIDDVHAAVKDDAVSAGLMIGQFHADCSEPSARNRHFQVNQSPVPLLAIRHMSVHDILFLHDDPSWFDVYVQRFGHLYQDEQKIDPAFRKFYDDAVDRFVNTGHTNNHHHMEKRCPA